MPSPIDSQPGLLLRDPFRYTDTVIVVPPEWVAVLRCLDGEHTLVDVQTILTRLSGGQIVPSGVITEFVSTIDELGFLETEQLEERRLRCVDAFRSASVREPSHAGSAYPDALDALETELADRFADVDAGSQANTSAPVALAAPHVSPFGGYDSYKAAYGSSLADQDEPVFVILGTSHYGEAERFGLTRKAFRTPLGEVPVDEASVSFLEARGGEAVLVEDYCHAPEHSIELQVVFLQYRLRRPFRIVPILCGPFARSLLNAEPPEELDSNVRMFDALTELADRNPNFAWVLGVDLSHVGLRYGDEQPARAGEGHLLEVEERDRARLARIAAGDAEGFFELVHPNGDDLNWCGYSPLYTFLHVMPALGKLEARLRSYEQWNIDDESVVSFAAMHFHRLSDDQSYV
jgi:AmmeMemoRadiSam system protein B